MVEVLDFLLFSQIDPKSAYKDGEVKEQSTRELGNEGLKNPTTTEVKTNQVEHAQPSITTALARFLGTTNSHLTPSIAEHSWKYLGLLVLYCMASVAGAVIPILKVAKEEKKFGPLEQMGADMMGEGSMNLRMPTGIQHNHQLPQNIDFMDFEGK